MRKFSSTLLLVILLFGCSQQQEEFTKEEAITKVLELHPNFPSKPNEVKKVKSDDLDRFWYELELSATKVGRDTYIITLGKNNRYVIDGEVIEQYWIYKVTPDDLNLIENEDNTSIMIETLR